MCMHHRRSRRCCCLIVDRLSHDSGFLIHRSGADNESETRHHDVAAHVDATQRKRKRFCLRCASAFFISISVLFYALYVDTASRDPSRDPSRGCHNGAIRESYEECENKKTWSGSLENSAEKCNPSRSRDRARLSTLAKSFRKRPALNLTSVFLEFFASQFFF